MRGLDGCQHRVHALLCREVALSCFTITRVYGVGVITDGRSLELLYY